MSHASSPDAAGACCADTGCSPSSPDAPPHCAPFLLVAALVVLVWKRDAIGKAAPAIAGLLLAAATVIRESDLLMLIPAVLYQVAIFRPGRRLAGDRDQP